MKDLNKRIAKWMGWEVEADRFPAGHTAVSVAIRKTKNMYASLNIFSPTEDIRDAMMVVERMIDNGLTFECIHDVPTHLWCITLKNPTTVFKRCDNKSLTLAICKCWEKIYGGA